jgi:hypothetical protein
MSQARSNKIAGAPLAVVLERAKLAPEVAGLVTGVAEVAGVIAVLVKAGFALEASRVFAHALPRREAVWWACMCAGHTAGEALGAQDRRARELAEQWVRSQEDAPRREAMEAARAAGMQSPDAWAGVAAFWSGESITPAHLPPVPPPAHLTGVAVAGAVALSSVRADARRQGARLARFLRSAQDIAEGGPGRLPVEAP